jgi:hypothetical protein
MMVAPDFGLRLSDASIARYEADRQRDMRVIEAAVSLATIRVKAEMAVEAELRAEAETEALTQAAAAAPVAERSHNSRGLGQTTKQAIRAGAAVIHDLHGRSNFPRGKTEMARAIADTAMTLGISDAEKPLVSDSRSVRQVAELMLELAILLDRRDGDPR